MTPLLRTAAQPLTRVAVIPPRTILTATAAATAITTSSRRFATAPSSSEKKPPSRSLLLFAAGGLIAGLLSLGASRSGGGRLSAEAPPASSPPPKRPGFAERMRQSVLDNPSGVKVLHRASVAIDAEDSPVAGEEIAKVDAVEEEQEESTQEETEETTEAQQAAYDPATGQINWDCPCLGGMATGPCGEEFKQAFSCFVFSEDEPKGIDCVDKFKGMQDCFRRHPEEYREELEIEDQDEMESLVYEAEQALGLGGASASSKEVTV